MLPGGGPHGANLGGLIFIVKYNGAFLRPPVPRNSITSKSTSEKVKFIDDGTVAVSVNMKSSLVHDSAQRPKPVNYSERTCQVLPPQNNLLQHYLEDAEVFTFQNKMKINPNKTKIIKFNKSRKQDFPPELFLSDNEKFEVVPEIKLVGVLVTQNLKW